MSPDDEDAYELSLRAQLDLLQRSYAAQAKPIVDELARLAMFKQPKIVIPISAVPEYLRKRLKQEIEKKS